jgi:hypothetical protein
MMAKDLFQTLSRVWARFFDFMQFESTSARWAHVRPSELFSGGAN